MDGLTISNSDNLLRTGKTASELRNMEVNKTATGAADPNVKSFAQTLTDAVQSVNTIQQQADVQMQKLATGQTKNIAEVMIATEKAGIAFKLLTQVRNKIIDAYQEIMKMQV